MARPRLPRSISPAWNARNARAQAAGYRNYYDYRAHDYGRIPPAGEPLRGEPLSRARGHRSAADLARAVQEGAVVMVGGHSERGKDGRYTWVDLVLVRPDGSERVYRLRGKQITEQHLQQLADRIDQAGGVVSPSPSLDLRRLAPEDDMEEAAAEAAAEAELEDEAA